MTKKVLCFIFIFALVMFLFTACSSGREGEQIVLPIDKQPDYLDPQIVSETGAKNIIANCFEGLVTYDENGAIVPAACENYTVSEDGCKYRFNLRTDGRWRVPSLAKETILNFYKSNEHYDFEKDFDLSVTADDFIFALRRALQPETRCPYVQSLMNIKNAKKVNQGKVKSSALGVKKDGDYTLVITLEKPDADFLNTLTLPACMPCNEEFFEITQGHYGLYTNYLIFNGPFYISNWSEKNAITARRNEYYRATDEELRSGEVSSADIVKPQSVYFSFNNEQETRDRKVKDGTYEIAPLTKEQIKPFIKNEKYSVKSVKSAVSSLIFNCNNEILTNEKMRKAITYALDISIVTDYYGSDRAGGIVPVSSMIGDKIYRNEVGSINIKKAGEVTARNLFKEALEELGRKDVEITVLCNNESETVIRSVMQKWQSVFGAAFGVSVNPLSSKDLSEKVYSSDYQIALFDIVYTDTTALNALARYTTNGRDNIVNYSSVNYDKLILKVSEAKSESKRVKALAEAEKFLSDRCCIVPVCESEVYYAMGKGVSGIIFSPTGEVAYYKKALSA